MDKKDWIYINNQDNSVRYALGTKGEKTLFCFGINPSTAAPNTPDPTIIKIESIANHNGYDSFVVFNVYPKRDTVFNNLEETLNDFEHLKNVEIITQIIKNYSDVDIWVAFGDHIYDREYLPVCLKDIYCKISQNNINWFSTGVNKTGSPKHPLYQNKDSRLIAFNMSKYIESL